MIKNTATNRQFGASGGVVSWDTSQDFGSSPPVRALPIPPPDAKLLKRCGQALAFVSSREYHLGKRMQPKCIKDKLVKNGKLI